MKRILIVDDERSNRDTLKEFLQTKGYECLVAENTREARLQLERQDVEVVLCGIRMPGDSAIALIRDVILQGKDIAPLILTGLGDPLMADKAFEMGAYDYITNPADLDRVYISIANALHRRELEINNRVHRNELETRVMEQTAEIKKTMATLKKTLDGVINTVALTFEKKDPYTSGHQRRVAHLASSIAMKLHLSDDVICGLRMACFIHDIGKINIPSEILSKPGKLTEAEFGLIRTHPQIGYDILKTVEFPWPIAEIIYQHHERINGSGYPRGLHGGNLLHEAKILGVADVVEAMSSDRPYRPALGLQKGIEELRKNREVLYDPTVVDACLDLLESDRFRID